MKLEVLESCVVSVWKNAEVEFYQSAFFLCFENESQAQLFKVPMNEEITKGIQHVF